MTQKTKRKDYQIFYNNWKKACQEGNIDKIKEYEVLPQYRDFLLVTREEKNNYWIINFTTIYACAEVNNSTILEYFSSSSNFLQENFFSDMRHIMAIFSHAVSHNATKIISFLFDNDYLYYPDSISIHNCLSMTVSEKNYDLIKFIFDNPKNNINITSHDYMLFKKICEENHQELLSYFIYDNKIHLNKSITNWLKGDNLLEKNYYSVIEKLHTYEKLENKINKKIDNNIECKNKKLKL